MASRITLPFWPSSLDCVSWSSDNIIAVGGGEQIGILTPRLNGPGPNGTLWNSTVFKANAFSTTEIPLLQPLTSDNFSAGEELSLRHVHALEWSPPGLGRFRQCVLAVLSSNHVLSLWECDGKTDVTGNWKRSVIVNHALISHYANIERIPDETDQLYQERKEVFQRVRTFAWGPQINDALQVAQDADSASRLDSRRHLIAVSTEAGEIVIISVRSPYDILHPEQTEWQIEVLHSFKICDIIPQSKLEEFRSGARNSFLNGDRLIADHIAWGCWKMDDAKFACSTLAFIARGQLFSVQIAAELNNVFSPTKISRHTGVKNLNPSQSDLTGPLRFVPKTTSLILFASDTVYCVDGLVSESDTGVKVTSHHLDDRWDEVSGLAFSYDENRSTKMQIVSHLSSSTAATTTLSMPLIEAEVSVTPAWQAKIVESKRVFSKQHDLAGHVQERTWGIAASPLGDYVATAITLLPSDSVAHIIPSEYRTVVNITLEVLFDQENTLLKSALADNINHVSSEVILSRLQRHSERRSQTIDADTLTQAVMQNMELSTSSNGAPPFSGNSPAYGVIEQLRSRVLNPHEMVSERFKRLVSIAINQQSSGSQTSSRVIQHLVDEVSKVLPSYQPGGMLSDRIRKSYTVLHSKLHPHPQSGDALRDEADRSEICRICDGLISFESVKWARCDGGHQFSRCALTFLAIQEPGVSKLCGVCGAQYLNEWKLSGLGKPTGDGDTEMAENMVEIVDAQGYNAQELLDEGGVQVPTVEPKSSLARILFATFDSCIYCGGTFLA